MTNAEAKAEALRKCRERETRIEERDAIEKAWREEDRLHRKAIETLAESWLEDCPHKIGDRILFSSWRNKGTWEIVHLAGDCYYSKAHDYGDGDVSPEDASYEVTALFRNVKKDGTLGKKEKRACYYKGTKWTRAESTKEVEAH